MFGEELGALLLELGEGELEVTVLGGESGEVGCGVVEFVPQLARVD